MSSTASNGAPGGASSLSLLRCLAHPERYAGYVRQLVMLSFGRWWLRRCGVQFGAGLSLYGLPIVSRVAPGAIVLGDRVTLCSRSEDTALGVARPVILRAMTGHARIQIGADTGLSGTVVCAATSVSIGARCLFGADVLVVDTDFHPVAAAGRSAAPLDAADTRAVRIGDDVFIGARAIVLKGVSIGTGAVVGAGAVVVRDVAPYAVVAGNPARQVGCVPHAPQASTDGAFKAARARLATPD